ncbi:ketopantoate reductase family protein [Pedobacter caeni]|uniref:2-dehydropantoate 2-reductase n=1 Tax=Pedobacter caeni TaxID=288992 RepID=A0A1M4VJT8_9SPHI|nr:2-dehydropantoate 2-reductase [Pedobacter caeni]SHE69271.1 2-dehydropantoate 2-reductase [Pedobacter caeni]
MEHLFIVGNGVIAKALAVALTLNGREVTILRGSVDEQPVYTAHIQVEMGGNILQADITISSISNYEKLRGIILLTNKSFGNEALANKLKFKAGESPIVFLQNGLHIESSFIEKGFKELYRCVLMATSQSLSDHKVRFRMVASSPIGVIKGSDEVLERIIRQLDTAAFSFRTETDIQKLIWKKVISNCVFNSICPLLETDNGVFQRNDAVLAIAKTVIRECLQVATENSIQLTEEEVLQNVLTISEMSDGQKISTYQDILNKRETEIETLNFAVLKAGGKKINMPVTALLGELTKLKSELSRV